MDGEEFDEDVINERSPLYSYMNTVGMADNNGSINEDDEQYIYVEKQQQMEKDDEASEKKPNSDAPSKYSFFTTKRMFRRMWLRYVSSFMRDCHRSILSSSILYEDDRLSIDFISKSWPQVPDTMELLRFIIRKGFSAIVLLVFMFWATVSFSIVCVLLLVCLLFLFLVLVFLRIWENHNLLATSSSALTTLVHLSERVDQVSRKSILYIQESEVVARGFTFVSVRGVINNLEASQRRSKRQCPLLRKSLFFSLRNCVRFLRQETRKIITAMPAIRSHDAMHSLADLREEEYGQCFTVEDEETADRLTDHYSIPALRAMFQLHSLHVSEILRILSLAAFVIVEDAQTSTLNFTPFAMLALVGKELCLNMARLEDDLDKRLEAHQRAATMISPPDKPLNRESAQSKVYTAVHSLSLHLQAALMKSQDIENSLGETRNTQEDNNLQERLQLVASELDASRACLEESIKRLSVPSRCDVPRSTQEVEISPAGDAVAPAPVRIIPATDPIIEDEVLEAFVESDVSDVEEGECWLDDGTWVASREEARARRQREKEKTQMVLGELKSVISVRARQWAERERRALRKQKLGEGDASSSESETKQEEDLEKKREDEHEEGLETRPGEELTTMREEGRKKREEMPLDEEEAMSVRQRIKQLPSGAEFGMASALAAAAISRRDALGAGVGVEEKFGDSSEEDEEEVW